MIRRILPILVSLTLLTACAGQPAAGPASAPAIATEAGQPTAVQPQPTATEGDSPLAGAGNCPAGSRLFDHELLASDPLCIPEAPERIIALDMASVEATLLAGKSLQATSGWILSELPLIAPQFASALAGLEDVGYPANLELVARLKPDLILAVGGTSAGDSIDYEQAKQIAPVVFADPVIYSDWKLGMKLWTAVLNVSADYDAMIANYDQRVSELQAALGDDLAREISVISSSTYSYSLWMPDTPPGAILSDVGLARPESQRLVGEAATAVYGAAQYVTVSEERFDLIDADAIFYFTYASSDPDTAAAEDAHLATFVEKPIWQALEAVKANQAFEVPGYWWRSQTYILANRVLDDLFTHLAGTTATTPVLDFGVAPAAFPVMIEHKYGSTEITVLPERIVTVGLLEQDALLALGVTPVGTTEWFGGHPGAIWPWAEDLLTGPVPELVGDGTTIKFEAIAALEPDVILALYAGLTQEQYDLLAQIAPTIAQPAAYGDYGIPWQELTATVGRVVGKPAEARALVDDVEARFAAVRAEHPEFIGASALVATPWQGIWVYGAEDVRGRLLTNLGFVLPEDLEAVTGNAFGGNLSEERADLLDVDAILWLDPTSAEGPLGGPLYASLSVHTEGREVFIDSYGTTLGGATSFVTVLSLPYLLDELVPRLAAAVDGDPATVVP